MASTATNSYHTPERTEGTASEPVLAIETRRVGCKTVYRVEGSNVWVWSERQAIEWYEAYGK